MLKDFLLVGLGGGIGSMLRYGGNLALGGRDFPYHTLIINIVGSLFIGIVFGLSLRNEAFSNNWKLFLATGICGGFTTFSAFSMENLLLLQNGKYFLAILYIILSIALGIAAAAIGFKLTNNA
jgi:fluoride exporter